MTVVPLPRSVEVPIIKAIAVVALWESGRFRTDEIAAAVSIPEAMVDRILNVKREAQR